MQTAPNDCASETTNMVVRLTKFVVTHYSPEDLLLRMKKINDRENALREISNGHVSSLIHFSREYEFGHGRETLSVTASDAATRSEESKHSRSPIGLSLRSQRYCVRGSAGWKTMFSREV